MRALLTPYAYDRERKTYYAPHDPNAQSRLLYSGQDRVFIRRSSAGRLHYARVGAGAGGAPETPAHIYAKMFFKQRMRLLAVVDGELTLIFFATCLLEQRLAANVPDVTVTTSYCWPPRYPAGTAIFIEIHATNDVHRDPNRIPKLRELGTPCIEVSLPPKAVRWRFEDHDSVDDAVRDFERYMNTILQKPCNCRWVVPEKVSHYSVLVEPIRLIDSVP